MLDALSRLGNLFRRGVTGVVLDLDGTLWVGECAIPGARDFCEMLMQRSISVVLLSNTGERRQSDVRAKFERVMDLPIRGWQIWTALDNLCAFLDDATDAGRIRVVYVVAPARNRAWQSSSFARHAVALDPAKASQLTVAAGACVAFLSDGAVPGDFLEMSVAVAGLLDRGCPLYATSDDDTLSVRQGAQQRTCAGPGIFLGAVRKLVQREEAFASVRVFGKGTDPAMPRRAMALLRQVGFTGAAENVCFVGDRLNADVRAALQVGSLSVHVQTGCHDEGSYRTFPRDTPHATADSVSHVAEMFSDSVVSRARNTLRDVVCTTSHQMRSGTYGRLPRAGIDLVDRLVTARPRRIMSAPELSSLSGADDL